MNDVRKTVLITIPTYVNTVKRFTLIFFLISLFLIIYNQQSRVTDHRVGLTLYGMDKMMQGELLDEFGDALKKWRVQEELREMAEGL